MSKIFISCDEATTISDKKQYVEANLWERMKLTYHLLFCKNCRVYDEQNTIVTNVINKNYTNNKRLSKEEIIEIQEEINSEL